jgi:hypothetical protein
MVIIISPRKLAEFADIPRQLNAQSDRGAAIIGGAFVEHFLERLLLARMRADLSKKRKEDLFNGHGPLAGFAAKIEVGFALNLFGEKCRSDLQIVKSLRDKFAHEIQGDEWSFSHRWAADKCRALQLVNIMGTPIPTGGDVPDRKTPRGMFIATIYLLSSQLDGEAYYRKPKLFAPSILTE